VTSRGASSSSTTRTVSPAPWSPCWLRPAFCQLTGYARRELAGADLLSYVHPDDQPAFDALIQQIAKAFLTQIQAQRPGLQVLFMSGYERLAGTGDGWPDATTQVIGKPFSRAALLARIAQVMAAGTAGTAGTGGTGVSPGEQAPQPARGERAPQPVRVPRQ
jgi:PAS fold